MDELGFIPLSKTGAEMLFEVFSQRHERTSTLVTSNLPFAEWTEVLGSERLTGALLDRLTHHVHILEMNGGQFSAQVQPSRNCQEGEFLIVLQSFILHCVLNIATVGQTPDGAGNKGAR